MDDRIAEIREAVEFLDGWDVDAPWVDAACAGLRAYADLLDSDALKINLDSAIPNPNSTGETRKALVVERDENGRWPDWVLDVSPGDEQWTLELMDALASSQGVEP